MIADELARARDACDALRSDDPLRPEMRSLLDEEARGEHAMWTMKCAVVCALAGMVCTVAAASGEAYNGGFGGELARCTGGTDAAAPREGGELGVGGRWPGTEAHDAPHAARRLREGRGSRVLTEAWWAGYGAAGAQGRTPCAGIGTGERDRRGKDTAGMAGQRDRGGRRGRKTGRGGGARCKTACLRTE